MRTLPIALVATALALAGCGQKSNAPAAATNTSSGNPLTAPVDYLGAVVKAKQTAEKVVDTTSIQQAIQMFSVEKGRYPKSLDELVEEKIIPRLPEPPYGMKFTYDPATGTVKAVKE